MRARSHSAEMLLSVRNYLMKVVIVIPFMLIEGASRVVQRVTWPYFDGVNIEWIFPHRVS